MRRLGVTGVVSPRHSRMSLARFEGAQGGDSERCSSCWQERASQRVSESCVCTDMHVPPTTPCPSIPGLLARHGTHNPQHSNTGHHLDKGVKGDKEGCLGTRL